MNYDILIKNGYVVDPACHVNAVGHIAIRGDRICAIDQIDTCTADQVIDAAGYYVMPGLIDFHTHVFYQGAENSIQPDAGLLPCGVTTAVDGGSSGSANFEVFHRAVISNSAVRICAFLNVAAVGQPTMKYNEDVNPLYYDVEQVRYLFKKYPKSLIGLKLRQSKEIVKDLQLAPLKAAIQMAKSIDCPLMVHMTNPAGGTVDVVNLLRAGDIFTHVYHGTGSTILNLTGQVEDAVKQARQRGVIFDTGNGCTNFTFATALAAGKDHFFPDIISSDITVMTLYRKLAFGLPFLMSKHLAMGMSLYDVVTAVTATPAKQLGMANEIGTLAAGACADVAIFKLEAQSISFSDVHDVTVTGQQLLVPQVTVRGGRVVYRDIRFGL